MPLISLFFAAALLQQPVAPPVPAPDRSGEAMLRKLAEWAHNLDRVHILISRMSRDQIHESLRPEDPIEIFKMGGNFRVEQSGYWGDQRLVITDGKSVLTDTFSDYEPLKIEDAGKSLLATFSAYTFEEGGPVPFFYLLEGPSIIEKIVAKDQPIRVVGDSVVFESKLFGATEIGFSNSQGNPKIRWIQFTNLPFLNDQYKKFSEWWTEPSPGALTKHYILIETLRSRKGMFSLEPPKGRLLEDKRKKAVKPPQR